VLINNFTGFKVWQIQLLKQFKLFCKPFSELD